MARHRLPVAVIGGGSAGISAVAALAGSGQQRHVVWFDAPQQPSQSPFAVGELQAYRSVPANTKVDKLLGPGCFGHPLLAPWIAASEPTQVALRELREQAEAMPQLEPYDPSPDGWVGLEECRAVYAGISDALAASEHVTCVRARVDEVLYKYGGGGSGQWAVRTEQQQHPEVQAAALVLATGGKPRRIPLPRVPSSGSGSSAAAGAGAGPEEIPLHTALDPEQLRSAIFASRRGTAAAATGTAGSVAEARVAILGNSHTAVVILDLCRSIGVGRVHLIGRRAIRHAEWVPEQSDYRYTMSGLKGRGSLVGRLYVDGTIGDTSIASGGGGGGGGEGGRDGKRRKVSDEDGSSSAAEDASASSRTYPVPSTAAVGASASSRT